MPEPRFLILEASHRSGWVALAEGPRILGERRLDEARRHARDLVPACAELLREQSWTPRDLTGVLVGRGPGSYTGLRVGIMSAKTLAYATGCVLLGIDTFASLAAQAPGEAQTLDVVADAQQDKVYVQRFVRSETSWQPQTPLAIITFGDWLATLPPDAWVIGPGLEKQRNRLPTSQPVAPEDSWTVRPSSMLTLGLTRWSRGERDDPFALAPLYLRPSSAEEQWTRRASGLGPEA